MPTPSEQDTTQSDPLQEILKGVPVCQSPSQNPEMDQEEALRSAFADED